MEKQFEELLGKVKEVVATAIGTETEALKAQVKAFETEITALKEAQKKEAEAPIFSIGSVLNDQRLEKAFEGNSYAKKTFDDLTSKEDKEKFAKDVINHGFLRALVSNDVATIKALSEGTTTEGGYLVPSVLKNEIFNLLTNLGLARKEMTVVPMTSKTLDLSSITTKPTVYWVGEGAQITASDPVFGRDTITALKLAAICAMSDELIEDSGIDIVNLYIELIAEAMANEEDKSFFNTNSSASITGLLEDTGVNLVNMGSGDTDFADISYDDLVDMVQAIHPNERRFAKWSMHSDIIGFIKKLKDTANMPIWNNPISGEPATLLGFQVLENTQMPAVGATAVSTKFAIFGNFKRYIVGVRREVTAEVLTEGTVATINLAEKASKAIRVIERIGGATPLPAAFSVLKTAAS